MPKIIATTDPAYPKLTGVTTGNFPEKTVVTTGVWPKARIVGEEGFPKILLSTFAERLAAELGGLTPTYYFDFIANRAIFNGTDVGTIANIPSLSGTLALSPSGHLIDSLATCLSVPVSGITFPCTMMCEFVRTVDSGAVAQIGALDDGTNSNLVGHRISATDLYRPGSVVLAGAAEAAVGALVNTVGVVSRGSASYSTDNIRGANLGVIEATPDVVATLPSPGTRISFGLAGAVQSFTGYIRKFAIVSGATTDKQLQQISSTF